MIPETQLESYRSITNKEAKQLLVLQCIKQKGSATLFELVKFLGWPVNRISGRITELRKDEKIIHVGFRMNPETRKRARVWRAI